MGISYKPVEQHLLVLCEYFGDGSFGFKKKKKKQSTRKNFFPCELSPPISHLCNFTEEGRAGKPRRQQGETRQVRKAELTAVAGQDFQSLEGKPRGGRHKLCTHEALQ
jgi:hypothetical protein